MQVITGQLYRQSSGLWESFIALNVGRSSHSSTALTNGKVLLVGGYTLAGTPATSATSELFDTASSTFTLGGALTTARAEHTANLLPSGKLLVHGGRAGSAIYGTSEVYNPIGNTFAAASSSVYARTRHTAVTLPDGKILACGGLDIYGVHSDKCETYSESTRESLCCFLCLALCCFSFSVLAADSLLLFSRALCDLDDLQLLIPGPALEP